jgi:hypothetical protein
VAEETVVELRRQVKLLEGAFREMDLAKQEAGGAGAKFQLFKASAGTVDDFHAGLGGRVGEFIAHIKLLSNCVSMSGIYCRADSCLFLRRNNHLPS